MIKNLITMLLLAGFCSASTLSEAYNNMLEIKPIKWAVVDNVHIQEHLMWAAGLGWLDKKVGMEEKFSVISYSCLSLAVELYQLGIENDFNPVPVYGSWERWFWDTMGDYWLEMFVFKAVVDNDEWDLSWMGKFNPRRWAKAPKDLSMKYNPMFKQLQFEWRF